MFADTDQKGALFGEFVACFQRLILRFELSDQHAEGGLDASGGGMSGRIVAGVGDEAFVAFTDQVDLFYLEASGAVEDDLVIGAAGEQCTESPGESIDRANFAELTGAVQLFGNGAADGAAEHGFQVGMDARVGGVEGFGERGFEDREEGVLEIVVGGAALVAGRFRCPRAGF